MAAAKDATIESRKQINAWVTRATRNLITEVFNPYGGNPNTVHVVANAIYFKGGWRNPFRPRLDRRVLKWISAQSTPRRVSRPTRGRNSRRKKICVWLGRGSAWPAPDPRRSACESSNSIEGRETFLPSLSLSRSSTRRQRRLTPHRPPTATNRATALLPATATRAQALLSISTATALSPTWLPKEDDDDVRIVQPPMAK
ncbi:hypothetical protein EJB05_52712, partial [Eragrostis curvula]